MTFLKHEIRSICAFSVSGMSIFGRGSGGLCLYVNKDFAKTLHSSASAREEWRESEKCEF